MQRSGFFLIGLLVVGFVGAAPIAQWGGAPFLPSGETDWDAQFKAPAVPPFGCKALTASASKPTDINKLRFTDVDVVMALGDSITAAFAAREKFLVDGLREFRGVSWATGGDAKVGGADVYTLPNFLHRVGGILPKGSSIGDELPVDAIRSKDGTMPYHGVDWVEHLNVAQSMGQVQDLPAQADFLIARLKKEKNVNMEEDWKMLTIMIGANNGCGACENEEKNTPQNYYLQMNTTITKIQANIPRLFINLVLMFNTSGVYDQQITSKYCNWVQTQFVECPCMEKTDDDRRIMDEALQAYNQQLEILAKEWTARGLKDFKIVAQPALRDMKVPSREYLSGVDCFHPNQYAHGAFAIGLWNNLQQAEGQKSTTMDPATVAINCPGEDQYLQ